MVGPAPTKRKRILVVEDNPLIRDSFARAIERLSAQAGDGELELLTAEDGGTAWEMLQLHEVDLVVTDLYIPVLSGIELIERMRSSPRTQAVPILAMSASIEDARVRSLGAGADRFLQKPLRLVDVVDAIGELLHLHSTP